MVISSKEFNQTVYQHWCDVLEQPNCDPEDDFFDLGGTSLQAVSLFSLLKQEHGISLPTTILLEHSTAQQLSTELYKRLTADQPFEDCLSLLHRNQGDKNLFLFHPIGGLSAVYIKLARELNFAGSIYGVSAPRMNKQDCIKLTVEELASRYSNTIQKVQVAGDYLFAGYSAGGIFAFATACKIQSQGQHIAFLGLIDTQYTVRYHHTQVALPRRLLAYANFIWRRGLIDACKDIITHQRLQKKRQTLSKDRTKKASLNQQREQLLEKMLEKQDFSKWYPTIQTVLQVIIKYYEPSPLAASRCKVVLYQTEGYLANQQGNIGWPRLINGKITNRQVDGDHLTVLNTPNYQKLAQTMHQELNEI